MKNEIEIPDGYEAKIVGNKVVFVPKESEDEQMRKEMLDYFKDKKERLYHLCFECGDVRNAPFREAKQIDDFLAYLEKQKEYIEDIRQYAYNKGLMDAEEKQKPLSTEETELNSIAFLEQLGYTCVPPGAEWKPEEWSEEDDTLLKEIVSFFKDGTVKLQRYLDLYAGFLENKFKSLRPQPCWKPSKEQIDALKASYSVLKTHDTWGEDEHLLLLLSLYNDFQKLL